MDPNSIVKTPGPEDNPVSIVDVITDLGTKTINNVLLIAGAIAIGFLVYNSMRLMQSQGNEEQVEKAKKSIMYSIWGIVLITLSLVIAKNLVGFIDTVS